MIKGDNINTYKDRSTKRDDDKEEKADHWKLALHDDCLGSFLSHGVSTCTSQVCRGLVSKKLIGGTS